MVFSKMAPVTNDKLKLLAPTLLLGGATIALIALVYLFLSPKMFQATARLRIVDWVKSQDLQKLTDERVVFVECDLIRSNVVVDPVIQSLNLKEIWGKVYHQGTPLSLEEARARFDAAVSVRPVPHSSLIDIRVTGENADETARIANALSHSYLDYRQARHQELIRDKLAVLKKQWDSQSEKIREAQGVVDKLYFEIIRERSTNETQVYDADAYDLLVAKRVELQAKFIDQQSQLVGLKKLDRDQLKDVLSSMDTNSLLAPTLQQLSKAKSDLLKARLDHAEDSKEVQDASLVVDKINTQVSRQIDAVMALRQTDLDSLQTMLKEVDHRIKNASTNAVQPSIKDTHYNDALGQLKQLKQERDNLQKKMDDEESQDAIKPTGVTADIIEVAETPSKPFIPDPKVAVGGIAGGFAVMLAGVVMFLIARRPKPVPRKLSLTR